MLLQMAKGNEQRLAVEENILDPEIFMHLPFSQALDALEKIINNAKGFKERIARAEESEEKLLYEYSNNIIAFSAERGQGKTSTMISLSNQLQCGFDQTQSGGARFQDCSFTVLPPIDPTVLEEKQSILALILSRMYRLAEETWRKRNGRMGGTGLHIPTESDKNELLDLFQKCLNGINAIKFPEEGRIQNLMVIHEMSDSAILKERLYWLTEKFLQFCRIRDGNNCFLVIQLDDTDFQIEKGYDILEDIRKYLTIPNVIFLMATDRDLLRGIVTQYFFDKFSTALHANALTSERIFKNSDKYLDKLIAPSHVIYLPELDAVIRAQSDFLHFRYQDGKRASGPKNNLLAPEGYDGESAEADFSFQSLVLRYIYRKTGIAFVAPESELHGFLPTTLRGLSQLLELLSSMEDIPVVPGDDMKEPEKLAKAVLRQIEVQEVNLALFEGYFFNDWVNVKLPVERAEIIRTLRNIPVGERSKFMLEQLREMYTDGEIKESEYRGYAELGRCIDWLKEMYTESKDVYFLMAVSTCLSIQFHKVALYQKKRAIKAYQLESTENRKIIFDFSPASTGFPSGYNIPEYSQKENETVWVINKQQQRQIREQGDARLVNPYMTTYYKGERQFSVLNLITLFLALGRKRKKPLVSGDCPQEKIYKAQEMALFVETNPEVQRVLTDALSNVEIQNAESRLLGPIGDNLTQMDHAIREINQSYSGNWPMMSGKLTAMMDVIFTEDSIKGDIPALTDWFDATKLVLTPREKRIKELNIAYQQASTIKDGLDQGVVVQPAAKDLMNACKAYQKDKYVNGFDFQDLKLNELTNDKKPKIAGEEFLKIFAEQLEKLCKELGLTTDEVIDYKPNAETGDQ